MAGYRQPETSWWEKQIMGVYTNLIVVVYNRIQYFTDKYESV